MKKQTSFKIWKGNSPYNHDDIACFLTGTDGSSKNPKTGPMIQLWILPDLIKPVQAVMTGKDECVCGDCPLRPQIYKHSDHPDKLLCYVAKRSSHGARAVWEGSVWKNIELKRGLDAIKHSNLSVRLGAQGDPAMLPKWLVKAVVSSVNKNKKKHTCYTHMYNHKWAQWIKQYAMASVENEYDGKLFRQLGWRTFRVTDSQEAGPDEIVCPNITNGIPCNVCGLCDGKRSDNDNRKSITVPRH